MQRALPHAAPRAPAAGGGGLGGPAKKGGDLGRRERAIGAGSRGAQTLATPEAPEAPSPDRSGRPVGRVTQPPSEVPFQVVPFWKVREWAREHGSPDWGPCATFPSA